MICDWCQAETPAVMSSTYSLRINGQVDAAGMTFTDYACESHARRYLPSWAGQGAVFQSVSA